jgi:hypothetical protein
MARQLDPAANNQAREKIEELKIIEGKISVFLNNAEEVSKMKDEFAGNKTTKILKTLDYDIAEGMLSNLAFDPMSLKSIYHFVKETHRIFILDDPIAVCTGSEGRAITNAALLVGAFMIIHLDMTVETIIHRFQPISSRFEAFDEFTVEDCWRAIRHTKELGWLDFDLQPSPPPAADDAPLPPASLDMEEYLHYDDPANGSLHFVAPDRLLLFRAPEPTPEGLAWHDAGRVRRFAAAYYADLFADLGVALVLRVGPRAPAPAARAAADAAAFAARGVGAEDVPLDADGRDLLRSIDRFLSLTRRAPGPVAVHGGPAGLGRAAAVVAACLVGQHGFPPPAAVAWLRIARPPAADRPRAPDPCPDDSDAADAAGSAAESAAGGGRGEGEGDAPR